MKRDDIFILFPRQCGKTSRIINMIRANDLELCIARRTELIYQKIYNEMVNVDISQIRYTTQSILDRKDTLLWNRV